MAVLNFPSIYLFLAAVAYFIYKLFTFFIRVKLIGKAVDQFPMEKKHWFWGHLNLYPGPNEAGLRFWQNMTDKYPRCYGFWSINWFRPSLSIYHPDVVKRLLKTTEPKSTNRGGGYRYGFDWIGNGLLLSSGERWQRNRKLLNPAFQHDNLIKFLKVKNQCVDIFVEKLSEYADKGESIEIMSHLSALTLDIILRCAFSYDNDIQQGGKHHPYMEAVEELSKLWMERAIKPWLMFDFVYKLTSDGRKFAKYCQYAHNVSNEIISKRKEQHDRLSGDYAGKHDILDVLLKARDEDGRGLSHEEIRAEVDTILFAGHDTTSVASSWTLYSLAQNPQHQKRCQEEIEDMFAGKQDDDVSNEDFQKLPFLTCCVKESMRMNSPVPLIERELANPMTIDGKKCPAGLIVTAIIHNVHHNGTVWTDHTKFDPERFFPENIGKMDSFAFIPFSMGPRNCIGQHFAMNEMKIILSKVLRRFTFSLDPDHTTKRKFGLVMKTEEGMFMKIKRR